MYIVKVLFDTLYIEIKQMLKKRNSFLFLEPQLITVLLLICGSNMS